MHQGNYVRTSDGYFSVNAWYEWGVNVIDWTDPSDPKEVAFNDEDADNWAAYWYEGPSLPEPSLTIYGTDGVEDPPTGEGFQVFRAGTAGLAERKLGRLNPQTQEGVVTVEGVGDHASARVSRLKRGSANARTSRGSRAAASRSARHLAP
jgi:hypothetical protein